MASQYRLITIPPSHFCEKARWALALQRLVAEFRSTAAGAFVLRCYEEYR